MNDSHEVHVEAHVKLIRSCGKMAQAFEHHFDGKHGKFTGRPYRRGANRCDFCGAPSSAKSSKPLQIPQLYLHKIGSGGK